jgi:predicted O-methyltransferase YrrM
MKEFTSDWVSARKHHWEELVLPPLLDSRPPRYLEVGAFEGRSICWISEVLENIPGAEIHCVDPWSSHNTGQHPNIEKRFDHNISELRLKPHKHKMLSQEFLMSASPLADKFDVIYIDGDHQAKAALTDAILAWPLLRKGGILVFDDYPWQFEPTDPKWLIPPKFGIDAFLELWAHELEVLRIEWQVYLRKK